MGGILARIRPGVYRRPGLRHRPDAEIRSPEIGDATPELDRSAWGLGAGETQALQLAVQSQEAPVIVSDDRSFLGVLSNLALPFLVPSHVVLGLARDGSLSVADAKNALDALRPTIRASDYLEALESLGD